MWYTWLPSIIIVLAIISAASCRNGDKTSMSPQTTPYAATAAGTNGPQEYANRTTEKYEKVDTQVIYIGINGMLESA